LLQHCAAVAQRQNEPIIIKGVGCLGPCSDGPLLAVDAGSSSRLFSLEAADANEFVAHFEHSTPALGGKAWQPKGGTVFSPNDPFLAFQRRLVLAQCGRLDPESIEEAEREGAYEQLHQVLLTNDPFAVIEQVRLSGLRGRGGAGYPTGLKWAAVAAMPGDSKVVVCNADEGDPGAFMDRTVMEGDPHTLLEGMVIAAFAVGAERGWIYVRGEYPLAIERLRRGIEQARQSGWLGGSVGASGFRFDLELRVGAGAYVCGEETALIHSIEGRRGVPRPRPPFPAEQGVHGFPTLINNVETFANIPALLRLGLEAYGQGTKVFSLTGHVQRSGVVEVPMGTSLRTIVETMAGGPKNGHQIKAVQTGGPSGGCVPASHLDTPVDYESLRELGTIMGSGGMVVMDDTTDMVDLAAFFMAFCREESCGKCIPCRCGTVQLEMLLRKLLAGQGTSSDLSQLESLCHTVKEASLCGLGQNAPNPVLSSLRHYRGDFLALLQRDRRP
jgi:bidirectional [NiFe] hydrogenase diaphorase subunit